MKMHVLSGGRLRMKKHIFISEAGRDETLDLPVSCFLLRHAQANVLFDTGCHPSAATDPQARWGGLARAMVPIGEPEANLIHELGRIGIGVDDIDVVVNSHLHMDHCGCNEFFKRATMMIHARELATARDAASEGKGYFRADWDHPMAVDAIERERDLFGDGRVVLIPLPGHTPGTTGALARLDQSGSMLLTADAVTLRANLDADTVPKNTWNAELFLKSMAEIRRIESGGATVICGHDLAQWETLKKGERAYE